MVPNTGSRYITVDDAWHICREKGHDISRKSFLNLVKRGYIGGVKRLPSGNAIRYLLPENTYDKDLQYIVPLVIHKIKLYSDPAIETQIVHMYFVEHKTSSEIAKIIGLTKSTICNKINKHRSQWSVSGVKDV